MSCMTQFILGRMLFDTLHKGTAFVYLLTAEGILDLLSQSKNHTTFHHSLETWKWKTLWNSFKNASGYHLIKSIFMQSIQYEWYLAVLVHVQLLKTFDNYFLDFLPKARIYAITLASATVWVTTLNKARMGLLAYQLKTSCNRSIVPQGINTTIAMYPSKLARYAINI